VFVVGTWLYHREGLEDVTIGHERGPTRTAATTAALRRTTDLSVLGAGRLPTGRAPPCDPSATGFVAWADGVGPLPSAPVRPVTDRSALSGCRTYMVLLVPTSRARVGSVRKVLQKRLSA
jgi:hypothetical protein